MSTETHQDEDPSRVIGVDIGKQKKKSSKVSLNFNVRVTSTALEVVSSETK